MNNEPERTTIRELYFEWKTGHLPEMTFKEYLTANTSFEPEEITWGLVAREIRMSRKFINSVTYEEAKEK
jgi:hypothetical protein